MICIFSNQIVVSLLLEGIYLYENGTDNYTVKRETVCSLKGKIFLVGNPYHFL